MKIAFIGSRGIPARYSGFEQFYEQLAVRLVNRGHEVTVYNRSHFIKDVKRQYKGVNIVSLPSIKTKHLDTISHTALSSFHAIFKNYDVIYYCIVGNSPLIWIPRIFGAKTLINVDGEDWAREKWSGFAKIYQKWCERVACLCSNIVIADAKGILSRYKDLYNYDSIFVPYGANIKNNNKSNILEKWNLEKNDYILYVGRFVPENAIDILIKAFKKVNTNKKLIIIGDAPYSDEYKKILHKLASPDKRIIFTGYAFEDDYEQLSTHAYIYVQPAGIDGTRPALLDQMGFGNCVLVRNSKVNMEVIGECGIFFDKNNLLNSLTEKIQNLIDDTDLVEMYRKKVTSRIKNYYNWEWVTYFYEILFKNVIDGKKLTSYDEFIKKENEFNLYNIEKYTEKERINILGVGISPLNLNDTIQVLLKSRYNGIPGYVCVTGAHGIIESINDLELKSIHNKSLLTVADGMPNVWIGLEKGFSRIGRVYGPELMLGICEKTSNAINPNKNLTHYLYGATQNILDLIKENLEKKYPNIKIIGKYSPPYRDLNESESNYLINEINTLNPDFIWVGLSTPKQERFMAEYINKINSGIMIGVGAAFNIHAGVQKDSPQWIKDSGLQWLHRLIQEPKRLWKRYLNIVPRFSYLASLQCLGIKKFNLKDINYD
ncbi:MAG: WecB/TagA/CpsF family glycosyltransferase [Pontiellaceae bacterium]